MNAWGFEGNLNEEPGDEIPTQPLHVRRTPRSAASGTKNSLGASRIPWVPLEFLGCLWHSGATFRSVLEKRGEKSAEDYSWLLHTQTLQPLAEKISRRIINSELYRQ